MQFIMKNKIKFKKIYKAPQVYESFNKKRIDYLDIARAFAIISVVLCHAVEFIYNVNLEG